MQRPPFSSYKVPSVLRPSYPHSAALLTKRAPPPPMPSPQVVPTALPTPPSLPRRRSSRNRLQLPQNPAEPPIPPRLIGSPLLHRLTTSPQTQPCYFSEKAQSELWLDGDEFGIGRKENAHLQDIPLPPLPSPLLRVPSTPKRSVRRSPPSSASRRSNSPPPTAKFSSPPPPVPPIPASALASPGSKRSAVRSNHSNSHLAIPDLVLSSASAASVDPPQSSRRVAT
ncbi:unnamed protein product [Somion occarium]|uniref:Uncharacterized protein n=1 Tax=Somion occarium TaxID=3059160 RepID=A0ABP1CYY3_9APHY